MKLWNPSIGPSCTSTPTCSDTRESLDEAREKIIALRDHGIDSVEDPQSKEQVIREIEKLEAFVTSPKFRFYDQAQRPADH